MELRRNRVIGASLTDLPPVLKVFLVNHLLQEISRPRTQGAPKKMNGAIERFEIAYYVRSCVNLGLYATRNDSSPKVSACDAVAEALRLEGKKGTSYSNIKKIWHEDPTIKNDDKEW